MSLFPSAHSKLKSFMQFLLVLLCGTKERKKTQKGASPQLTPTASPRKKLLHRQVYRRIFNLVGPFVIF
jgi:hypothetical protein